MRDVGVRCTYDQQEKEEKEVYEKKRNRITEKKRRGLKVRGERRVKEGRKEGR